MAFIELIEEEGATGDAAAMLAAERAQRGAVPNFARAFAHHPSVYAAWRGLVGAMTERIDPRLYELVTVAAAQELRSSYCCLAHGTILAERDMPADQVVSAVRDPRSAGLTPVEVAAMELAARIVRDATSVTEADVDRLRDLGLDDGEIFDIVIAATARCFFSKTLDALGVPPDRGYASLEPALRDALVTGRAIAE